MRPAIALIAAVARNGVIGRGNDIPWRIPSDFAHFKRTTMGKPLVMGRKQFESVGKALPGRANLVVTRQPEFSAEGVEVFSSLDEALARAAGIATSSGVDEIMVIGGGQIYAQTIGVADRLYISHVELSPEGDSSFPPIDPDVWIGSQDLEVKRSERDAASYRVTLYERRTPAFD